jgi:hypothetical protein
MLEAIFSPEGARLCALEYINETFGPVPGFQLPQLLYRKPQ